MQPVTRHAVRERLKAYMRAQQIYQGIPWMRVFQGIIAVSLFSSISVFSLAFALGYQYVWPAGFVRTGLIQITSPINAEGVEVLLNERVVAREFPVRIGELRPQRYTVAVRIPGYREWIRSVDVPANERIVYNQVLFMKQDVVYQPEPRISPTDTRFSTKNSDNLYIKEGSELFTKDGVLITRFSERILSAVWHPLKSAVIVQTPSAILLVSVDGLDTHTLYTPSSDQKLPVPLFFDNGGRELVLNLSNGVSSTTLYESMGIIDRLVGFGR